MTRVGTVGLLLVLVAGRPAFAGPPLPGILKDVGFDQRLNAQVPLDLPFTDDQGRAVKLKDYFGDKPVVLVLAYYRCPMLCSEVLNGVVQVLRETRFRLGQDFRVLTVSFDPDDHPAMAAAKRKNYLRFYGNPDAGDAWRFLTGGPQSIAELTRAVGFRYAYDAASDQYAHAAGIMILTPAGRVSRYFYDVHYSARDLRVGLVAASQNKIGSAVDQVLLFCFHYDPAAGTYGAAILNLVRAGGVVTVFALAGMFIWLVRLDKARRQPAAAPPLSTDPRGLSGRIGGAN